MNRTTLAILAGIGMLSIFLPAIAVGSGLFVVDDNGNVGIGNISPMSRLDVSGAIYSRLVTDTASSSVTIDWNAGNVHSLDLRTWNTALAFADEHPGGEYKLILNQDEAGFRGVTWPDSVQWIDGAAPKLSTAASSTDLFDFLYDGTRYLGSYTLGYAVPRMQPIATVLPTRSAESSPTPEVVPEEEAPLSSPPDSSAPSPLLAGLVSYWKLDESSGDAMDSVGSNILSNNNSATFGTGIINNDIMFAKTATQYMYKNSPSSVPGADNTGGDMTVSGWVKMTSQPANNTSQALIGVWDGSGAYRSWVVEYTILSGGDQYIRFNTSSNGSTGTSAPVPHILSNNTWYMVTVVYTATAHTVSMYINGAFVGTIDNNNTSLFDTSGNAELILGAIDNGTAELLDGELDEWGIWNRALSENEITDLYNGGIGLQYPF